MNPMKTLRKWAAAIKADAVALWFAKSHPRTPWYAKALGVLVVAYALSPIDLIPDFIPVLGYLDDLLLLPILIWITVRLIPPDVLQESRQQAADWMARTQGKPRAWAGAVLVGLVWVLLAGLLLWKFGAHAG